MAERTPRMDDLIARLRARATDPDRRVDVRPSLFDQRVGALDLGGLIGQLRTTRGDLASLLDGIRSGELPAGPVARAGELGASMAQPAPPSPLSSPVDDAAIAAAEARLGFALPRPLRRIYTEVADGGFGPGRGLESLAALTQRYLDLRLGDELPRGRGWQTGLLPLIFDNPVVIAVDTTVDALPVIEWDPDGLSERASADAWARSFDTVSPTLVGWFAAWLDGSSQSASPQDDLAERIRTSQIQQAREARARFAAMTPEERAGFGLPAVGWEQVVWGGLGLDEE
jgi:hypothetical protein